MMHAVTDHWERRSHEEGKTALDVYGINRSLQHSVWRLGWKRNSRSQFVYDLYAWVVCCLLYDRKVFRK